MTNDEWSEQVAMFATLSGPLEKEMSDALSSIGFVRLSKVMRELGVITRLVGGGGNTDYALASFGRVLSPLSRMISKDSVLFGVLLFAFGPSTDANSPLLEVLVWSARWHEMGMPTVRVTAEQVAALSLTDIDKASAAELRAPWPAFSIAFEGNSFPVVIADSYSEQTRRLAEEATAHLDSGAVNAVRIAVIAYQGECCIGGVQPDNSRERADGFMQLRLDTPYVQLWTGVVTIGELCTDAFSDLDPRAPLEYVPCDQLEKRAILASKHLAVNVIQAMLVHGLIPVKHKKKGSKAISFGLRSRKEYTLGAPVHVNAVPALHRYLTGVIDRAYKVRWIVRGHWRNQACGPSRANVNRKWIQPHWKGHVGDPINIREHVL